MVTTVFCPNRLRAVSVTVRNPLSRLSGVRLFFVLDTGRSGYAMPPGFALLSPVFPEMPECEDRDDRHAVSFPDSLLRSLPSV